MTKYTNFYFQPGSSNHADDRRRSHAWLRHSVLRSRPNYVPKSHRFVETGRKASNLLWDRFPNPSRVGRFRNRSDCAEPRAALESHRQRLLRRSLLRFSCFVGAHYCPQSLERNPVVDVDQRLHHSGHRTYRLLHRRSAELKRHRRRNNFEFRVILLRKLIKFEWNKKQFFDKFSGILFCLLRRFKLILTSFLAQILREGSGGCHKVMSVIKIHRIYVKVSDSKHASNLFKLVCSWNNSRTSLSDAPHFKIGNACLLSIVNYNSSLCSTRSSKC